MYGAPTELLQEGRRAKSLFPTTYGTEAVLPVEIRLPSMRTTAFCVDENDKLLTEHLDFLEEDREIMPIHLADYQQKLSRRYNRNVHPREFVVKDLILRRELGSLKESSLGKLALNWKGPYHMTAVTGVEAYYLEDLEEMPFPQPWIVSNLKKYFR